MLLRRPRCSTGEGETTSDAGLVAEALLVVEKDGFKLRWAADAPPAKTRRTVHAEYGSFHIIDQGIHNVREALTRLRDRTAQTVTASRPHGTERPHRLITAT